MLGKGLHHCFSRLKRPSHSAPPPLIPNSEYTSTSTSASASASSSAASLVFKNFNNSLYDPTASDDSETLTLSLTTLSSATAASSSSSSSLSLSAAAAAAPAPASSRSPSPSERDLSTAIASRRFFPASPGRSKSIVDSAAAAVAVAVVGVGVGTGVAVPTYSPDPYGDFRRSMEEMVAALGLDAAARRTHLHELLLCYLALNSKRAHKYIIGAFADLLLGLGLGLGLPPSAASEECLDAST